MTTPSLFQMLWGRAHLTLEFASETSGGKRLLHVCVKNPPVRSRVLKSVGVKRETIQSLQVTGCIQEAGSGKVLLPVFQCLLKTNESDDDRPRKRIALPPTYSVAASAAVVMWNNETNKAVLISDKALELGAGQYRAGMIFLVDGEPMRVSRDFVVGENADNLYWVEKAAKGD